MSWLNAIPWIIAVLGWFAAHAFSEARERRKETRSHLDKLYDRLASIEKSAISFHTNEKFDFSLARELLTQLDRTERLIGRIQILSADLLQSHIIAHRQSITLVNFDSSEFHPQDITSELIQEITNATLALEDEVDRQYQERYPTSFPYFKWPGVSKFFHFWR